MMRICILFCAAIVFVITISAAQDGKGARPQITTAQIGNADVIGALGVPLGTCVRIRATIFMKDDHSKRNDGRYFLKITHVDSLELATPAICEFHVSHFASRNVKVTDNDFRLYELRTGRKTGSLSGEQLAELRKGYVGTAVHLDVVESGGFHGIPQNLPKGVAIWQDVGFHFSTSLTVYDQQF